jgi:outer membrane beta-barrel protein
MRSDKGRRIARGAIIGITLLAAAPARADDDEQVATYAVQNRRYRLGHELNFSLGVLPLNAFTKGLTVGGSYTYNFTDDVAWEVAQFIYSFGVDTDLKKQLEQNFTVQPTQIESLNYAASTNLILKPFYGKFAFFNRRVLHAEIFAALGGAFGKYVNPSVFRGGFDAGLGIRLHAARHVSVRLDVRDYVFFKGASPQNELFIALSLALAFGREAP